jgi:hypothetical protein
MQLAEGLCARPQGPFPSCEQDSQRLSRATLSRQGQLLLSQCFACSSDRVELVGLAGFPARTPRSLDLDHPFFVLLKEGGEP